MLCRSNPSHRYTEPISDSDRVNLARNIQYVMMSAFKGIPSTQEIREWLRDDNNREYLFTYSEESSSSKFGELKALIGAQKHLTRDSLYEHLELDATREQLDQTFSDYAILRPFRSQVEDFIGLVDKIYESGKCVMSVLYFASTADEGDAAQRDYAARVFLSFTRQVLLKDRPIIWAFMRKESYDLISKERLSKINYQILFDEPEQIAGEELRQVVMLPQEFIDSARINMFTKKLAIKTILRVARMISG